MGLDITAIKTELAADELFGGKQGDNFAYYRSSSWEATLIERITDVSIYKYINDYVVEEMASALEDAYSDYLSLEESKRLDWLAAFTGANKDADLPYTEDDFKGLVEWFQVLAENGLSLISSS